NAVGERERTRGIDYWRTLIGVGDNRASVEAGNQTELISAIVLASDHLRGEYVVGDEAVLDLGGAIEAPNGIGTMIASHDQAIGDQEAVVLQENPGARFRIEAGVLRNVVVHRIARYAGRAGDGAEAWRRLRAAVPCFIQKHIATLVGAQCGVQIRIDRGSLL